jgi:hypothetical protein
MSQHHQNGHLRRARRRIGLQVWEHLWRETDATGRRIHRTAVIGTLEQYPMQELAWAAANGLRMHINNNRNRYPDTPIPLKDLIDHYVHTDLSSDDSWHSRATRTVYRHFL